MSEHDASILGPKAKAIDDVEAVREWGRAHWFCQACGLAGEQTRHHIIGGRGGRSDEAANLLSLCWEPCHMLAEGLDVRGTGDVEWQGTWHFDGQPRPPLPNVGHYSPGPLLPKITLGIALAMKIRAGELQGPILLKKPASVEVVTSAEWDRLTVLHGRGLPAVEAIPAFFVELFKRNRPELHFPT